MPKKHAAIAKISAPRLYGVIPRGRLFESLDRGVDGRAVWIAGPPGAGKTALVASYAESKHRDVVWYQVDAGDADPSSFFYFLSLTVPGRKAKLPLLQPEYLADLDGFSDRFFRAYFAGLPTDALLVLDNVQEFPADSPLYGVLARALAQLPPGMAVIAISRQDAPPELARLRANGDLHVIVWPELQLTLDETERICQARSLRDPTLIESLHGRSGGWVAGLTLMLERVRRGGQTAPDIETDTQDAIFDYFAGQIFRAAPERDRQKLLRAAFAPRLTTALLCAMTDDPEAGQLLDALYRRHLFTDRRRLVTSPSTADSTAQHPYAYQFHALFRAFLRREAERVFAPAEIRSLMERTAALLEREGMVADAVDLYAEAREWKGVEGVVLRDAPALLQQGRWRTIVEWTDRLPKAVLHANPWLLTWTGKALVPIDQKAARDHLERAWEHFVAAGDRAGQLVTIAGIVWTHYFEAFATESMDRWIEPLEALLGEGGAFPSPSIELAAYSAFQLVTMFVKPSHPMLHPCALRLIDLMDSDVDVNERVSAAAFLVQYLDLVAQFDLAARVIEKVDRLTRTPDLSPVGLVAWYTNRGYHFYITARYAEAMDTLDRAVAIAHANGLPQGEFSAHVFRAFAAAIENDISTGLGAVRSQEKLLLPMWRVSVAQYHLSMSLLEQQRGHAAQAADHARRHLAAARTTAAPFFIIVWGSCGAGALAEAGLHQEARDVIEEVRAAREGTCYTCYDGVLLLDESYVDLLEHGEARALPRLREGLAWARRHNTPHFFRWLVRGIAPLLACALKHDIETDYVRSLIAAWRVKPPTRDATGWPWSLRIVTLGHFRVLQHDQPLRTGRKAPARLLDMLKVLVALGGEGIDVRRLSAIVWPDAEGDAAQASFTNALHRLRKLLGDDSLLDLREGRLSLNLDRCWVDVLAFEAWCQRRDAVTSYPPARSPGDDPRMAADRLLDIYRGHFLPQEADSSWVIPIRERLRSQFERQIGRLGDQLESAGEIAAAMALYRRAIEIESLTESFYQRLMHVQAAAGARAEALQTYRRCRDLLSIVLGVQPSAATQAQFELIRDEQR